MSTIITVENLGKKYTISSRQREDQSSLRDALATGISSFRNKLFRLFKPTDAPPPSSEDFWALKDVFFDVKQGERVGIIGRNGAGKSTLLKILSRITEPTAGSVRIKGKVASLLEVGTGFHPELTGRENIYLNGAILGMSRQEIRSKFDEIVDFSEIGKFLDTPVKHYSSGMYVRLAFAVAAHLEPEILIVDEVLAVGDAQFQNKCIGKMRSISANGDRTILFVSHSLRAISELCDRCIWIDQGTIRRSGQCSEVLTDYASSFRSGSKGGEISAEMHTDTAGDFLFTRISMHKADGTPATSLALGCSLDFCIEFLLTKSLTGIRLILIVERLDGTLVDIFYHTDAKGASPLDLDPGQYAARMRSDLPLSPGSYNVQLLAKPAPGYWEVGRGWDWVKEALTFVVEEVEEDGSVALPANGVLRAPAVWQVNPSSVKELR